MAKLSQISKVLIALRTASPKKALFGIPLIVTPTTAFSNRVKIYNDYNDAVEDGLEARALSALNAAFAQSPRPSSVYVGRREVETVVLTSARSEVTIGNIFSVTVGASTFSYTTVADDTVESVYTALANQIKADSVAAAAYDVTGTATGITMIKKGSDVVAVKPGVNLIATAKGNENNIAVDLVAIASANRDWYGFSLTERSDQLILQSAIWAEAQTKLFFACSGTAAIWAEESENDVASQLKAASYHRTALIAHKQADTEFPEAAWMGRCFTIAPGGETWALKDLTTITPSDFDATQQSIIWSKNANTYEAYGDDTYLVMNGTVSSGEWIDIIRGRDYAEDFIQKEQVGVLIRNNRVPYTNPGIQTMVNTLRGSLVALQNAGIVAPDEVNGRGETVPGFVIQYPNAADVSAAIKAKRVLYLGFNALIAGAIHVTEIDGTMSYNYGG